MKKLILYMLLLSSCFAVAQAIVVPDTNFKAKLLQANAGNNIAKNSAGNSMMIDANYDGIITENEAHVVRELYISNSNISSLAGIEYFINLKKLDCDENTIATLDISSLEDLVSFRGILNGMTSLTVNNLSNLEVLDCAYNNLTSIDLTGLESLRELNTSINPNIASLDLSGSVNLEVVNCNSNNLSELNVSMLVKLTNLDCSNNHLTTLDLNSNVNLTSAGFFSNDLVTLFIKNGQIEQFDPSNWAENPALEYICADEYQIGSLVGAEGMPETVQINSYCSYEPGGIYNRIVGTVKYDANNNNDCDEADYIIPAFRLKINAGGFEDTVFTKPDGTYIFYVGEGDYTVTPVFENEYFLASPAEGDVTFESLTGNQETRNFCIKSNGVSHPDVEVVIEPLTGAQPGLDATYKMVYKNKGNQVINAGNVTCFWNSSILEYVDMYPMANGIGVNSYSWNYTYLKPFESREITMKLNVNSPTETPPVNVNDVLAFTVSINPGTDDMPVDNTFDYNQVVTGSYDPNNIICLEGESASPDDIGDYLHYAVNFENTGTAPINFAVVQMDIDPDQYDINTLTLINNSNNEAEVRTTGNRVEVRFSDMMLAVDGNGNLLYKIKSRNGLVAGTSVTSKANIYFDYNFPVETEPAVTRFAVLGLDDHAIDNLVKVYPNPSKDVIKIDAADTTIKSIQLYDIQGRLLQIGIVNEASTSVDISGRADGIYLLKITTDKGIKVEKIIKQ